MIKQLSLRFSEEDYRKLKKAKDKSLLTWEHFLLSLVKGGNDGKNNKMC